MRKIFTVLLLLISWIFITYASLDLEDYEEESSKIIELTQEEDNTNLSEEENYLKENLYVLKFERELLDYQFNVLKNDIEENERQVKILNSLMKKVKKKSDF